MEEIKTDETTKSNIRKDIEKSNSPSEQWQILLSHHKGSSIRTVFSFVGYLGSGSPGSEITGSMLLKFFRSIEAKTRR